MHLRYFIINNHPFVDGKKRGGAYALGLVPLPG
jgi:prophage maintenance system killer protein